MNRTKHLHRLAVALALSAGLAGCGGGGDGGGNGFYPFPIATSPPPVATNPPPQQADPYETFIAYVQKLVGTMIDTDDAADVAAYDPPPTSEIKDPVATQ